MDTVRELFLDSVRLRLRSDVRVGTCLSGGIDSSAIACGVDHLLRTEVESRDRWATARRRSPSTSTSGYDERPYARAVVDRTLATPTWISFNGNELVAQLPGIVEAHDEPFRSTSICAGWFVMRAAREAGVTVVLDGQGGDEVFAGYPAYYAARYADLLAKGRAGEVARELAGQARAQGAGRTATMFARALAPAGLERLLRARRSESDALLHPDLRRAPETVERVESPYTDRLRMLMTRILTVRGLPELLHAEDRNSMAHSLEARVPFLDYRLVELSFSLDGGRLLERGTTKAILRRALADLLPPSVAARTDKLGFVTPEALWLRGPRGGVAADAFASQRFADRGFVDVAAARRRLERTERASSGRVRALARSTSNWRARPFSTVEPHAQRRPIPPKATCVRHLQPTDPTAGHRGATKMSPVTASSTPRLPRRRRGGVRRRRLVAAAEEGANASSTARASRRTQPPGVSPTQALRSPTSTVAVRRDRRRMRGRSSARSATPSLGLKQRLRERRPRARRARAARQALRVERDAITARMHNVEHHQARRERVLRLAVRGGGCPLGGQVRRLCERDAGARTRHRLQGARPPLPHSLGILYTAVTQWLGFRSTAASKIMGLALRRATLPRADARAGPARRALQLGLGKLRPPRAGRRR